MNTTARSALAALALSACAALTSASLPGQAELEIQLAADPERRGPPALTWLRTEFLPQITGVWPDGLDPLRACVLTVTRGGVEVRRLTMRPAAAGREVYLAAEISLPDVGVITARCDFDGREVWRGSDLRLATFHGEPRWQRWVELLGLRGDPDAVCYDIAALVGNRCDHLGEGDPLAPLLTLGASECGEVTVATSADVAMGTMQAVGRSRGGLLLPALLYVLADERGFGQRAALPAPIEQWLLLATAARDGRREEAARQLALSWDLNALDMLERLLLCDDYTRVVAMDALLHRPDAALHLDQILRAATSAITDSQEIAAGAASRLPPVSRAGAIQSHTWMLRTALASTALLALAFWLRRRGSQENQGSQRSRGIGLAPEL